MRTAVLGAAVLVLAGCTGRSNQAYVEPPGSIALVNPDFEAAAGADGAIEGWNTSQHAGPISYKFGIDRDVSATGAASARIERTREQVYGMIAQSVPISAYAGHTIEFSAQMKTAGVGDEGWQLMLTFSGGVPNPRRTAAPLTGTQDFRKVTVRAQVPPGAREAELAAILNDRGTAWLDDVHLRIVD